MVETGRVNRSPLARLRGLNAAVDRRHDRRALTADEARRLLAAAYTGPERFKVADVGDFGGYADFHALRHSIISALARGGCSVRMAQALARHSDPKLTLSRYSHVELNDQSAALDALPDLSFRQETIATGTFGSGLQRNQNSEALCVPKLDAEPCTSVQ